MSGRRALSGCLLGLAVTVGSSVCFGEGERTRRSSTPLVSPCQWLCYVHGYVVGAIGRGLRFNNPFRLETQLGDSPESLSATAPYADLQLAMLLGDPYGWQHGVNVATSIALYGVPQQVLAPGYATLYRFSPRWQLRSRVATPIVLAPDTNVGVDLAAGTVFSLTAGLGVSAETVFSLYQGAGTDQQRATLIPIMSGQLGLSVDYEVLP